MNVSSFFYGSSILTILLLAGCTTKTVIRQSDSSTSNCPPVLENSTIDTVTYTITFSDTFRRDQFVGSFRSFLNDYNYSVVDRDTALKQIIIRVAPSSTTGRQDQQLATLEPEWITETTIEKRPFDDLSFGSPTAAPQFIDTILPNSGGKLKVFMNRTALDAPFIDALSYNPFIPPDSITLPLLDITMPSPKKIVLKINVKIIDGTGRLVSALDLIESWTNYVKKNPAEGYALFRHVEGILEFIQGKEAVIRGFGATDQQTCYCKLATADPVGTERIMSPRIFGITSRLGAYFNAGGTPQEMLMLANRKTANGLHPYLDTLVMIAAEDPNPILSFSLRKYDAIVCTFLNDISYARTTLEKQADLTLMSSDRYFISCAFPDSTARQYLTSRVNAQDLLQLTVKAEGTVISAVTSDSLVRAAYVAKNIMAPAGRQLRILFRKDDPVSRKIAEKLLADLSNTGIRTQLVGAEGADYERHLIERKYECAVGWADKRVLQDESEKLRIAAIFFNDLADEQERLDSFWEIPLFSVNRYLLMRKPAGLYHGNFDGIFATSHPSENIIR